MKRSVPDKRHRVAATIVLVLAFVWSACAAYDTYEVRQMTEQMKTVCVGRMLIDLPADAYVRLNHAWISGLDIETVVESEQAFAARVAQRESALRQAVDPYTDQAIFESVQEVRTPQGLAGKIFIHSRKIDEAEPDTKGTDRYFRWENVAIEAYVRGNGLSFNLTSKLLGARYIDSVPKLIAQIVPNPGNAIPTESGFCINRAYIREPLTAHDGERITLQAGLPGRPDIEIRFDTLAGTPAESIGLLARNEAAHARAPAIINMRFANLRAAPRTIGTFTGDELVERVLEWNMSVVYGFQWETPGTEDDVLAPAMTLMMATGRSGDGPIPSSLSQPAAVALWDRIASSIRIRPARAHQDMNASVASSLGMAATAGESCPVDGWWECSADTPGVRVHGGQRQYFAQGQRIPQALFLPKQSLWEKARGMQSSYQEDKPTVWYLADRRRRARVASRAELAEALPASPETLAASMMPDAAGRSTVGSYASTGNACPAGGWWQCQEPDALDGTRWFAQGAILPEVTFAPHSAADNTAATAVRRPGIWQLVRTGANADTV